MEDKNVLINLFRTKQETYVYYVIALAVACIGFAVNSTLAAKLTMKMIPLGISMIGWLISIYCGLRFLFYQTAAINKQLSRIQIREGVHPMTGNEPYKIKIAIDAIDRALADDSKTTIMYSNIQHYTLYIAVVCFILWRILDMMPNV